MTKKATTIYNDAMTDSQFAEAVEAMADLTVGGIHAETIWMSLDERSVGDFWRRTQAWIRFAHWASETDAPLTYDLLPRYRRHVLDATMIERSAATVVSWLRSFLKACPEVPEEVWRGALGRGRKADTEPKRDFLYDLFGLHEGYTQDDLRRGYRKAARAFHPDEERFMALVEAYDYLTYGVGELTYETYVRDGGNAEVEDKVREIFELVGGYSAVQKIKSLN